MADSTRDQPPTLRRWCCLRRRVVDHLSKCPQALVVFSLLLVQVILAGYISVVDAPTVDEPVHMVSGLVNWRTGSSHFNRGNPPLVPLIASSPLLIAGTKTGHSERSYTAAGRFAAAQREQLVWRTTQSRWVLLPFMVLGGFVCWRWARELYGSGAGIVALILWCFGPNVIAHGARATCDMAATACGVTAFYVFWKWLQRPSWPLAAMAGVLLGVTELTKYVWVFLYLLWPLLWLMCHCGGRIQQPTGGLQSNSGRRFSLDGDTTRSSSLLQLGAILLLSIYIINLGYAFQEPFRPLGEFRTGRRALSWIGLTGNDGWIANVPVPLPRAYVGGADAIDIRLSAKHWSYLQGEWRQDGWWYYYLYGLLVKLPCGTILLFAVAGTLVGRSTLFSRRRACHDSSARGEHGCGRVGESGNVAALSYREYSSTWQNEMLLIAPIIAVLVFVTAVTSLQHHVRYVLPVLPFIFIFSSRCGIAFSAKHVKTSVLTSMLLLWMMVSSLCVYPHSLSYFNELAGGPERGDDHLVDSNIDWGQDLLYLKDWYDANPQARPLCAVIFGPCDPKWVGVDHVPCAHLHNQETFEKGPVHGWYAISVHELRRHNGRYAYFLRMTPIARVGYSIRVYYLTRADARRLRQHLQRPPLKSKLLRDSSAGASARRIGPTAPN